MSALALWSLLVSLLLGPEAAEARHVAHIDFEGPEEAYLYRSNRTGSVNLVEFDDVARRRQLMTVKTKGQGARPQITGDGRGGHFVRFATGRSSHGRDRSEIIVRSDLRGGETYTVEFSLRVPSTDLRGFPDDREWFLLTQIQQGGHTGSPPLSINLRRNDEGLIMYLVGRNDRDGFERLATMRLDDPANFTFGAWNRIRLRFRMGSEGFAELSAGNGAARASRLRRVGGGNHRLAFADGRQQYILRMGLYRGGGQREPFGIDMDDIVVSTP